MPATPPQPPERITINSLYPLVILAAGLLAAVAAWLLARALGPLLQWFCVFAAAIVAAVGIDWLGRYLRR
jgi:hypothetical protein